MTKPIRKVKALVTFDWPEDASLIDIKDFLYNAVRMWGGNLRPPFSRDDNDPGDPMFGLMEGIEVEVLGEPL